MKSLMLVALCCVNPNFLGCGMGDGREIAMPTANGPEALSWLKQNKNESALASNRFEETENAIRFVQELYSAGAARVIVPENCIRSDEQTLQWERGPYADALFVTLPADEPQRKAVLAICAREIEREGFDPDQNLQGDLIYLWWD